MTETEQELIVASKAIGAVHEMASWATKELSDAFDVAGQKPFDMTVTELMAFIENHQP